VEFDNRDLIAGSEFAQSLPGSMRVLGKYHSQPHITVHPSHVDLTTQASYQTMDINFVGLIFSVFKYDPNCNTCIDSKELAAFQSVKGEEHLQEYPPQCEE
jgi:BRCA1/BRCA2-containing complex subunit 3